MLCVVCLSAEDTLNFWKGIADVGLLGEVVTNINTELVELLNSVQQRMDPASLQDTGAERRQHALGNCIAKTEALCGTHSDLCE